MAEWEAWEVIELQENYDAELLEASDRLRAAEARVEALTSAIEHVVNDSPGTPDSVKAYLRAALAALPVPEQPK